MVLLEGSVDFIIHKIRHVLIGPILPFENITFACQAVNKQGLQVSQQQVRRCTQ